MIRKICFALIMISVLLLAACNPSQPAETPSANMPNPASVFCEQNGGRLDLKTDAAGGVTGACIFPDGSQCDEWAFLRGECQPGDSILNESTAANLPNPASVFCEEQGGRLEFKTDASGGVSGTCVFTDGSQCDEWAYFRGECQPGDSTAAGETANDGWQTYQNLELGYRFAYPADARIEVSDDPLKSISIVGPEMNGEFWPYISLSHPTGRAEYRPPEGTDLVQWLADHNFLGDTRLEDIQIAGLTAVHLRHDRSPQSYAYDRYYFAQGGQLYMLVIGHSGGREDWALYNRFLASIQFE